MARLVSKTYGEALFDLSVEENIVDAILEEAAVVLQVVAQNPELAKLLNHPKIGKEEKITVVENIFKEKFSDTIVGFLVLLVQKDRHNDLEDILQYFVNKVKEVQQIGVANVTSAVPLSDEQKQNIYDKLLSTTNYKKLEMHYSEDAGLIGGLVIRIGDRVVDTSIRTRMNNLAKELTKIQLN